MSWPAAACLLDLLGKSWEGVFGPNLRMGSSPHLRFAHNVGRACLCLLCLREPGAHGSGVAPFESV